jgi:hypothetical protein
MLPRPHHAVQNQNQQMVTMPTPNNDYKSHMDEMINAQY